MSRRVVDVCLLAYPRAVRRRDGDLLRDLALDLAAEHGVLREAWGLLRGGLVERWRRGLATRRALVAAGGATGVVLVALTWPALGGTVRIEDEVTVTDRATVGEPSVVPDHSSGTVVAVRDGEIVACEGWGLADHESAVPAGCDTVYDIGSMTKQFTAAAVLHLEARGRLRVSDPMSRYLDGVPPDKREITVHHLLSHTSGLVDSLGGDDEPVSRAALTARALASELRSAPGARHHYSNVGYSLLAVIIEIASGTSYEAYLAEHLFGPAGMTRTGYVLPPWQPEQVAVEYDARGVPQGRPFEHPWAPDGPYWNLRGNGGILSTARDMGRWHLALDGDQVLDARAKKELFEPRTPEQPGGDSYAAYGWVVVESELGRVLWHNGGNGWSYGEIARVPDSGTMVFWVTNQVRKPGDWNLERDGSDITGGVLESLAEGRK